ncbi:MAG TPA: glycosyltransferase [Thermoanaerobaculia bacterium]|nr:glycosyltransferase [Thermoanaerobaculia bacterium]
MRVLLVATKAPWPPRDGGRLLLLHTLSGLHDAGVAVTLVAPVPSAAAAQEAAAGLGGLCRAELPVAHPRPLPWAAARALRGEPVSVARHRLAAVARRVRKLALDTPFHLVHAEQAQALPQAAAAGPGLPLLLRAQNVESDLWRAAGGAGVAAALARREGARLARWEGRAVAEAAAVVALTEGDARRLGELAGGRGRIRVVAAPFPAERPPGPPLAGDPPVVLLGSSGWLPNRQGAAWFLAAAWEGVRRRLPGARLHLFGGDFDGGGRVAVQLHAAPADSGTAFAAGALLVVPLFTASGVRVKVLEAWARGMPVVATPAAAAGLEAEPGRELLVAPTAEAFAEALAHLHAEPGLAAHMAAAGRELLRRRHDPAAAAAQLVEVYRQVTATPTAAGAPASPASPAGSPGSPR